MIIPKDKKILIVHNVIVSNYPNSSPIPLIKFRQIRLRDCFVPSPNKHGTPHRRTTSHRADRRGRFVRNRIFAVRHRIDTLRFNQLAYRNAVHRSMGSEISGPATAAPIRLSGFKYVFYRCVFRADNKFIIGCSFFVPRIFRYAQTSALF